MKRRLVLLLLVAALATGAFAANGWFDDFESPAAPYDPIADTGDWGTDKGWSTWFVSAGSGEGSTQGSVWGGSNWYEIVSQTGVAAPQNPGDWVVVEARFQITCGASGNGKSNAYAWNFGFETEPDGTGSGAECIFVRRETDIIGGAATGDQGWNLFGWQNISTIGLTDGLEETSDWFGMRLTVTMNEDGVNYTVLNQILNEAGEVITEQTMLEQELPTMAAADTWYVKLATQDMGINFVDLTGATMDNVKIYNNSHTDDPIAHTPTPEDGDTAVDSETLSAVAWEAPLTGSDPNSNDPNLLTVDQFDITYYILDNDAVVDDDPNWIDNGTKYEDVANPYTDAAIVAMTHEQTMFWRVDTHLTWDSNDFTGGGLTSVEEGESWYFSTKPAYLPPVITANDVITTVALTSDGNVAALSAAITNNTKPLTSVTWTLLDDDVDFPTGSDAALGNETGGQNPTAELTTTVEGFYKVRLAVTDGTTPTEEIIAVNVVADACQAKKDSTSGWTANYYDRDNDCDVDVADFAALALEWLDDTSMQAQEDEDYDAIYLPEIPQSVFDARIESESVDPDAVSDPPIDDDPLDGIRIVDKTGATGGQQALGWATEGAFAEYEIAVEAGTYDLWISYAADGAGASFEFGDGTTVDLYGSISDMLSTGSWEIFYVMEFPGAVTFSSTGTVTFRFTYGANVCDLDYFSLVKQP